MKEGMAGQKGKSRLWIGILLLALGVASFVYWGGKKQVWFCDEIYTYESANGFGQDWPATYVDQWMEGADVEAFFAADQDRLALNRALEAFFNTRGAASGEITDAHLAELSFSAHEPLRPEEPPRYFWLLLHKRSADRRPRS